MLAPGLLLESLWLSEYFRSDVHDCEIVVRCEFMCDLRNRKLLENLDRLLREGSMCCAVMAVKMYGKQQLSVVPGCGC